MSTIQQANEIKIIQSVQYIKDHLPQKGSFSTATWWSNYLDICEAYDISPYTTKPADFVSKATYYNIHFANLSTLGIDLSKAMITVDITVIMSGVSKFNQNDATDQDYKKDKETNPSISFKLSAQNGVNPEDTETLQFNFKVLERIVLSFTKFFERENTRPTPGNTTIAHPPNAKVFTGWSDTYYWKLEKVGGQKMPEPIIKLSCVFGQPKRKTKQGGEYDINTKIYDGDDMVYDPRTSMKVPRQLHLASYPEFQARFTRGSRCRILLELKSISVSDPGVSFKPTMKSICVNTAAQQYDPSSIFAQRADESDVASYNAQEPSMPFNMVPTPQVSPSFPPPPQANFHHVPPAMPGAMTLDMLNKLTQFPPPS
jgi:hypothetical protein